jgi:hypothetical protein
MASPLLNSFMNEIILLYMGNSAVETYFQQTSRLQCCLVIILMTRS